LQTGNCNRFEQKSNVVSLFADADLAARKLIEIANGVETMQEGRMYIERVNAPFLAAGGTGEDFRAGIKQAIALGWLWRHENERWTVASGFLSLRLHIGQAAHCSGNSALQRRQSKS
jgi:hypothetical protein